MYKHISNVRRHVGLLVLIASVNDAQALGAADDPHSDGDEPAAVLDEITVTALRIEESLQDVALAVTVLTGNELAVRRIESLDQIAYHVPNVTFHVSPISGRNSGQAYIRGIGQTDYLLSTDPGVGVYLDGVYVARSLGNLLDLVDIERIEVLRGPQGTLYGKNTLGGAVNVLGRKPAHELEAGIDLEAGSFDRLNVRASVSGSLLPDVLSARIAASARNADGIGRRPLAGDRAGDEHSRAIRGVLRWTPTDRVEALFSADYTQADERFSHHRIQEINLAAPLVELNNVLAGPLALLHGVPILPYDERWITDDAYVDLSTGSNFSRQKIRGLAAIVDWSAAGIVLRSISGYRDLDLGFGIDPDGSPAVIAEEIDRNRQKQLTQELQASGTAFDRRLGWVAGVYYLSEDAEGVIGFRAHEALFPALEGLPDALIPLGAEPCPAPAPALCAGGAGNPVNALFDLGRLNLLAQDTLSRSVYAHADFALTARTSIAYGLRYTREEKKFSYSVQSPRFDTFVVPPTNTRDSWRDLSHRAALEYRWNTDLMTYLSASKGFKSGGFNGRGRSANEIQPYDPEELWSYEFGFKSEWFAQRLRLNGAAFYYRYSDLQFTLSTSDALGLQVVVVGNAAEARASGIELEMLTVPTNRVQLDLSVGYLSAKYTRVDPGAEMTTSHKPAGAPRWTGTVGAEYSIPLPIRAALVLRADYAFRDKTYFDVANTESAAQPRHGLLNLRATLSTPDRRRALAVGVTNVRDEIHKVSGIGVTDSLGFSNAVYGRPREWFVQGSYRL